MCASNTSPQVDWIDQVGGGKVPLWFNLGAWSGPPWVNQVWSMCINRLVLHNIFFSFVKYAIFRKIRKFWQDLF